MTAVDVAEVVVDGAVMIDGLEIRQADGAMQIQLEVSVEGLPVGDGTRSFFYRATISATGNEF